jgi:hypothetical protein
MIMQLSNIIRGIVKQNHFLRQEFCLSNKNDLFLHFYFYFYFSIGVQINRIYSIHLAQGQEVEFHEIEIIFIMRSNS